MAKTLGLSLFLTLLIGGIGTLFAYIPDFESTPTLGLITVWTLSLAIGVAGFWNTRKPNWIANFIVLFSLSTLFLAAAIHLLGINLSGWLWLVLLLGAYLTVWTLPLWNVSLAKALHDEQVHPKTWLGRNQLLVVLLATILLAVVAGLFSQGQINPALLFLGSLSAIIAIGMGQYFAYQVRENWEEPDQNVVEDAPVSWKASRLLTDGLGRIQKGDFETAIGKFSQAIEAQPDLLDAYMFRGNAYIDLGEYPQALPDLDHVIENDPDRHDAYYNRSLAHAALEQNDLALADLDRAIQLEPNELAYYLQRSIVHSFREEYEAALDDAAKAVELGDPQAGHNNRAVIFEKMGDAPSAITEWTEVIRVDPKNARAHCTRGILLAATGRRKRAIEDLQRGLWYKKELPDDLREKAEKTLQELKEAESQ